MQTTDLLKVEYHHDTDTGMVEVGEIDFSVCGTLDEYLKTYGYEGCKNILATLGHLAYEVKTHYYQICSDKPMGQQKG